MATNARSSRKKNTSEKTAGRRSAPNFVRPIAIDLHSTELSVEPPKEDAEVDRGDAVFRCVVDHSFFISKPIAAVEQEFFNVDVMLVTCKTERLPSKLTTEKAQATYICAFERGIELGDENNIKKFYEDMIAISVWPRFKELLGTFVVQGNSRLPKPPLIPPSIIWKKVEKRSKTDDSTEKFNLEKSKNS